MHSVRFRFDTHFQSQKPATSSFVSVNGPSIMVRFSPSVMLAPQPGQFVAEVEGLELTPDKANFDTLRDIAASHLVKTPLPRCKLVKKQQ